MKMRAPVVAVFPVSPEITVRVCVGRRGVELVSRPDPLSMVVEVAGDDREWIVTVPVLRSPQGSKEPAAGHSPNAGGVSPSPVHRLHDSSAHVQVANFREPRRVLSCDTFHSPKGLECSAKCWTTCSGRGPASP